MENEVDLWDYLEVLLRRWRWLVGIPVLVSIVAAAVSLATAPTYEATAELFLGASPPVSSEATKSLFQSPRLERAVVKRLGPAGMEQIQPGDLLRRVSVTPDRGDPSLLRVTAVGNNRERVAQIANAWVEEGTRLLIEAVGASEEEVNSRADRLRSADEALGQFVRENVALGDLEGLAPFLLGYRSLGGSQITVDLAGDANGVASSLSPQGWAALAGLVRERDMAEEVYLQAARTLEALQPIVVREATVPLAAVRPRAPQNVLLAGTLGLMVGIFAAFGVESFETARQRRRESPSAVEAGDMEAA